MNAGEIGHVLRWHRNRAGLSRRQLAALSGISETAIYDIETGKETVRLSTVQSLMNVLNLRLEVSGPLMGTYQAESAAVDRPELERSHHA